VHGLPSGAQEDVHASAAPDASEQCPPQHSEGRAQAAPFARQVASGVVWHRAPPAGGAAGAQIPPAQQSAFVAHSSPSAPHAPAGWQRPPPWSVALHTPEQQSAFEAHCSHSARHPPAGAQRVDPSLCAAQKREQQSSWVAHVSPTWREQAA
jgi:hypothetical protein